MSGAEPVFFDVHQHFGLVPGRTSAGSSPADDAEARLAMMDRFGIAACAIMPGHGYSAPRGAQDLCAINDRLLAYCARAPERFVVAAGTVDPRHGSRAVDEVARAHALGMRALSWHHRMQGLPMDHPVMFDIARAMEPRGMVAMVHCYAKGDFESPWRLRRLAGRFPELRIVALDAMTSLENVEQLAAAALDHPNLHVDLTTTALGVDGIAWWIDRVGPERLLFGTNYYSAGSPQVLEERALVLEAAISESARALVAGGNARRLFGLEATP